MYAVIKHLFPGITDAQFRLQDESDGKGPYIARWDYPAPQPSLEEIAEVVIPPKAPTEVTMRQARLALADAGLLPAVDAAIEGMQEPQKTAARIEWEYSGTVQRNKPLVLALAPALGLTETQLDELFVRAATL